MTTVVKASDDDGRTWFELARQPDEEMALLFSDPHAVERCRTQRQGYYPYERLYLLGMKAWRGDLILRASDDGAATWSEPVTLRSGSCWNTATGYVIHENRLYWCVGAPSPEGVFNKAPRTRTLALAGDFSKDLLTP